MFDQKIHSYWGVRPILFHIFGYDIKSYAFFVALAFIVGVAVFFWQSKKLKKLNEDAAIMIFAAAIGGSLGAKIPIWIENYRLILEKPIYLISSGRTVVGGLIGGLAAVVLVKKLLNLKIKTGDQFVPALSISFAIGRIGCFLQGCCYGRRTNLPWGVNFGDGIRRHPTEIYESVFLIVLFIFSLKANKKIESGKLFQIFIVLYFIFRFLIEYLRQEPSFFAGLTLAQIVALIVLIYNMYVYTRERGFSGTKSKPRHSIAHQ